MYLLALPCYYSLCPFCLHGAFSWLAGSEAHAAQKECLNAVSLFLLQKHPSPTPDIDMNMDMGARHITAQPENETGIETNKREGEGGRRGGEGARGGWIDSLTDLPAPFSLQPYISEVIKYDAAPDDAIRSSGLRRSRQDDRSHDTIRDKRPTERTKESGGLAGDGECFLPRASWPRRSTGPSARTTLRWMKYL